MKKGFTLLELLIVVVIIGVLALIAAPTLLNATDRAKEGTVKANVSAAASSVTSNFALNSSTAASAVASTVSTSLATDNINPFDDTAASFATSGTAPGSVVLTGNDTANSVTIIGYGKTSNVLITKVINAPQ